MKKIDTYGPTREAGLHSWDELRTLLGDSNIGADWFDRLKVPVRTAKLAVSLGIHQARQALW